MPFSRPEGTCQHSTHLGSAELGRFVDLQFNLTVASIVGDMPDRNA